MHGLTDRQYEILSFIRSYIIVNDYPPTIVEIGEHFGIISKNGVVNHLSAIEKKGYIKRTPKTARGIKIL